MFGYVRVKGIIVNSLRRDLGFKIELIVNTRYYLYYDSSELGFKIEPVMEKLKPSKAYNTTLI